MGDHGKLLHIKTNDIDFDTGILRITGAYNRKGEETQGKNNNAIREVVLSDEAMNVVREQLAHRHDSEYLFPDPYGVPAKESTVYKHWSRLLRDNGIEHISLYELRHTFVSSAEDSGMPMSVLQSMIGHSSKMDTNRHYGHKTSHTNDVAKEYADKMYK